MRLLAKKPNDADLLRTLAKTQLEARELERCEKTLARLEAALGTSDADLLEMRGDLELHVDSKATAAAIDAWTKALALDPQRVPLLEKLAKQHRRIGEPAAAALYLQRLAVLREHPADIAGLARNAVRNRDWDAAIKLSAQLRAKFANKSEAKSWNAIYDRLMVSSAELATLDAGLEAAPADIELRLKRAWLFDSIGLYDIAEDDARHALKLRPSSFALKYQHAVILAHAGESRQAYEKYGINASRYSRGRSPDKQFFVNLREYELRIEKGSDADAHLLRAKLLAKEGQTGFALADIKAALGIDPKLAEAHLLLAHSYRDEDKMSLAKQFYHRVLELDNDHLTALYELGLLHRRLGDFAEAATVFDRYLGIQNNQDVQKLRDRCLASLQKTTR